MYENRPVKPVEIVLRGEGERIVRVNLFEVYSRHMWNYHNEIFVQLIYINKK
jgi:hypothetical protein